MTPKDKAKQLPSSSPGVYLMKEFIRKHHICGEILKNLKNRVSSYEQSSTHSNKVIKLVHI